MGEDEIEHRFSSHQPRNEQIVTDHQAVRNQLGRVAQDFEYRIPDSREKSLAMTKLEEAMFWANAAIARVKNYQEE